MNNSCITNLLKFICLLQNNSTNPNNMEEGCTKPLLGPTINNNCYNSRIISIYKKDGSLFTATYNNNSEVLTSSLFRVMNVNDTCCTLLIISNDGENDTSTNQFITVDTNCICAIRCLRDVVINNL